MIDAPNMDQLEDDLRPGKCSNGGFLGLSESLSRVLEKDAETLHTLGLSFEQIADAIESVWSIASGERDSLSITALRERETDFPCLHNPETIPVFSMQMLPDPGKGFLVGDIQVFIVQYRGFQICPWGCPAFGSSDFMALNRRTGLSFSAPELIIHLIRAHGFFEGFQSPYRVDPELVIRTLEIPHHK